MEMFDLGQTREKYRIPLEKGEVIAEKVGRDLAPLADVLVLVGSIRRRRLAVSDVEFVILPKNPEEFHQAVLAMGFEVGKKRRKYTGILDGIKVELNIARKPEELGSMVLWHTGDHIFNIAVNARAKNMGYLRNPYGIWKGQKPVLQSVGEKEFFDFLGMDWHEPEQRSLAARSELEKAARLVMKSKRSTPEDIEFARAALRKLKTDKYLPPTEEVVLKGMADRSENAQVGHLSSSSLGAIELVELGAEELIELGDQEEEASVDDGWQSLYELSTGRFGKLRGLTFQNSGPESFEVWAEIEDDGERLLYRVCRAPLDPDGLMILEPDFVERALQAPWPWEGPFLT